MQANIKGLVERLDLPQAKAMMPLFEAISNSLDAIEEHEVSYAKHSIKIILHTKTDLASKAGDQTLLVDGIEITDDGVGFNPCNMDSFKEAYSLSKAEIGGKGVGRFTFLKVFSSAHVRSVFSHDKKRYIREFEFSLDNEFSGSDDMSLTKEACRTTVTLRNLSGKFRKGWPQDLEVIAERIVSHFLIRFASSLFPPITLECPFHAPIDLCSYFTTTILSEIEEHSFTVSQHEFAIHAYRQRGSKSNHSMHLCANGRDVTSTKL